MDFVRGVSALLVCANHLRAAMFVDYSEIGQASLLVRFFYFITGLGAQSVVVFFVLSGFFVGGSVIKRWECFSFRDYLLARVTRLWVVLIPALAATFIIDRFTVGLFPDVFSGAAFDQINSGPNGGYSDSFATLVANLCFLQTVSAPVFGSNGPLWSLSNEFWYYICFPLLCLVFDRRATTPGRVLAAAVVTALCLLTMQGKLLGFLVWIIGAGVYWLSNRQYQLPRYFLAVALPVFVTALVLSKLRILPGALDMIVLGICSGLLIVGLRLAPRMPRLLATTTEFLSRASYSLYLVHFPFVLLMYAGLFRTTQAILGIGSLLMYIGLLSILVIVSQFFWMLFERNTDTVKANLSSILSRIWPSSVPR